MGLSAASGRRILAETEVTELSPGDVSVLLEVLDQQVSIGTKIPAYMLGGGQNGGVAWHEFKGVSEANAEATADTLSFSLIRLKIS